MAKKKTKTKADKSLDSLQYTDGIEKDVEKIKDLERVLGIKQANPYGTNNKDVFEQNMAEMNLSDLQALAVRVGVFPSGTKTSLKNKLRKQFSADNRSGSGIVMQRNRTNQLDPNNPEHAETIRLMNEAF